MTGEELSKELDDKIRERLAEILSSEEEPDKPMSREEQETSVKMLREGYEQLLITHDFQPGQLVKWKSRLKNRRRPRINEPAIVISVLEESVFGDRGDSGSTYFREPLDLIIAVYDDDHTGLFFFHVDSRRFQPFEFE
jgi:hypothetical protein